MKAIVIGAGIAGIGAAIRLQCMGFETEVFEANPFTGGKLSEIVQEGYRFDAGPSLFTLPEMVTDLFRLAGENPEEHFPYIKLQTIAHYFFEDGTFIRAHADPRAYANELAEKLGIDPNKIIRFLKASAEKYELTADIFLKTTLHRPQNFLRPALFKKVVKAIAHIGKLDFLRTMNQANQAMLQHPKLVQLFNRYATYNGSDPYRAPATLNVIPHLEHGIGAFFPKGGMHQISQSLVELARGKGVRFYLQSPVSQIITQGINGKKVATGVLVNHQLKQAEVIVCNMDVNNAYRQLLPHQKAPAKILNQPKSSSALIFYWGIKKTFPQLDLHNVFFSQNYQQEFAHIFDKKTIYHDPTVYINITSKYKPDDAPQGCENWFVMINVPNNTGQNWDELIPQAREYIIAKLSRLLNISIAPLIATEAVLDPRGIEQRTSSAMGALYGNSSNNRYAAFLRHANFSNKIKNLYFCGGSVHPGGGIPLSLCSAKIVADLVAEDFGIKISKL
ncbi:MAG: 1-hydroxycarotenoid 3,4-desaturase CrtD [Cytophagales bacterium]|nr:phytoene desaturase family protein [Bernardetiaceae bacterium]MDW8210487.1 1-hydroxycarotenoid 3,4-desaturase CrtD [Cytophagales bacterium]